MIPPLPALICYFVGGGLLLLALRGAMQAKQSIEWPYVSGIVVASHYRGHSTGKGTTYQPYVAYEYEVEGYRIVNNQVKMHDRGVSGSRGSAQEIAQQYPIGAPVTVFYNPNDFQDSVLEPGETALTGLYYIAGFFLMVGVLVTFLGG